MRIQNVFRRFFSLFVFSVRNFFHVPSANKNKFPFIFRFHSARITSVSPTLVFPFCYYLYLFICFVNPLAQCRRQKFDFSVQFPLLDIKKIIVTSPSIDFTVRLHSLSATAQKCFISFAYKYLSFILYINLIVLIFCCHTFLFVLNVH